MVETKMTKSGQNVQQQGAPNMGAMYFENIMNAIKTGNKTLLDAIRNQQAPTVTVPPPKVEVHGVSKEDVETIVRNAFAEQKEKFVKLDKIDEIAATLNDIKAAQNSVSYLERIEISDLKYRYVRAVGYASPRMLFQLDSICSEGSSEAMDAIRNRIGKYEQRVREKSDSIVHAEEEKKARL